MTASRRARKNPIPTVGADGIDAMTEAHQRCTRRLI
jgi:hypothetical protein